MMRRILAHLVVKRRAAARDADRRRWQLNDLLFISAYGEEAEREISLAHFAQDASQTGELPVLRVLGWDGADTILKLEHLAATLRDRLRWPANPSDVQAWRVQWRSPFRHRIGHVIRTADALAEMLAALARRIRDAAQSTMRVESEKGPLTKLFKAFQASLIHDLTEEGFADTYAQTITYGLLTAAISKTDMRAGAAGTALIAGNITEMVPVTNPFLKEMLQTFLKVGGRRGGIDFDELGIQDVVELLRGEETDLPAILRDFGNKKPGEDPVIHFYEHFLNAYNRQLKIQRGVFYTPQPVVSYIVRSVHEVLQTEFGLDDGLASTATWGEMVHRHPDLRLPPKTDEHGETRTIDPGEFFVQILDPAAGTATFLVEVIDVVHRHLRAKWEKGGLAAMPVIPSPPKGTPAPRRFEDYWNVYVPHALLPRLHGYELMMAPYAIAHMKIGLKLAETGYRFGTEERARVYLTNALEPKVSQLPQIGFDALAHEAAAVNEIKWYKRFTVVIGNPPYSGISANMNEDAQRLVDAYKIVNGVALNERKLWLQDDYVKFIRKAQTLIEDARVGVLGYITNHGYLDNPTFRGMRQSLMATFSRLRVLDLHGNANKKERSPNGSEDKNVFDIRQGVGICIATRDDGTSTVEHADIWGLRGDKYAWLDAHSIGTASLTPLHPRSPNYWFIPRNETGIADYESGMSFIEIFDAYSSGILTARDSLAIGFSVDEIWNRIADFSTISPEAARAKYELGPDVESWNVKDAQSDVRKSGPDRSLVVPILYRPFDIRYTYYTGNSGGFLCRPLYETMRHMLSKGNLGIITIRNDQGSSEWTHSFVTKGLVDGHALGGLAYNFPLFACGEEEIFGTSARCDNFTPKFSARVGKLYSSDATPEIISQYIYGILQSAMFRGRYAPFLKMNFPRLPLTADIALFRALARLGSELVGLHLLESPKLDQPISAFIGGRNPEVEKVSWSKNIVWIDKAQTAGFKGVPEGVWNFHIGGYQVCEKWLKDRKSRTLSKEDITHYHKIVVALSETIRLMAEIDKVIDQHGGWPNAFATSRESATSEAAAKSPLADLGLRTEDELPLD